LLCSSAPSAHSPAAPFDDESENYIRRMKHVHFSLSLSVSGGAQLIIPFAALLSGRFIILLQRNPSTDLFYY
jgi:hypothetical protein